MNAIYAAPNLIYHYASVHKYKPPGEFIEAVKGGPRPFSKEYTDRLSELSLEWSKTTVPDEHHVPFKAVKIKDGVKIVRGWHLPEKSNNSDQS